MAGSFNSQNNASSMTCEGSDYGSDLDETTVDELLSQAESRPRIAPQLRDIEEPIILDDHGGSRPLARLARIRENLTVALTGLNSTCEALKPTGPLQEASIEVEYDQGNRSAFSRELKFCETSKGKLTLTESASKLYV